METDLIKAIEVEAAVEAASGMILAHERCTRQHVQNAVKNVKSHSSHRTADQYFAEIASQQKESSEFFIFFHIFFDSIIDERYYGCSSSLTWSHWRGIR